MNYDNARHNMVEQQVRTWEVLDARVLEVLGELPREEFVPHRHRKLAYADLMLPLDHGQVMMKPVIEGRILQSLALSAHERVLEVGTGGGYLSACLARLGAHVETVEIHESLANAAAERWQSLGIANVSGATANALDGWAPREPADAVVLGGAVHDLPEAARSWVKANGGRLFVIVGRSPVMEARLLTRQGDAWQSESLFETDLPHLIGAEPPESFAL